MARSSENRDRGRNVKYAAKAGFRRLGDSRTILKARVRPTASAIDGSIYRPTIFCWALAEYVSIGPCELICRHFHGDALPGVADFPDANFECRRHYRRAGGRCCSGTQNIVQGFFGALSDKLQKRKTIALAGYLLAAIAKPLIGLSTVWQAVLGARVLDRFGAGSRSAPRDALIASSVDEENRGRAFGPEGIGDNAGAFLGPLRPDQTHIKDSH